MFAVVLATIGAAPGGVASASAAERWSLRAIGAITQPAPVGSRFVLYVHSGGSLKLIAVNAGDGSTAWVAPAAVSNVTPGVPPGLAVRGSVVYYLEPAGSQSRGLARVVARNVASGKIVWRTGTAIFQSWPEICADQPDIICLSGEAASGMGQLRFDAITGQLVATVPVGTGTNASREIASGLFDTGARHPQKLLFISDGRAAWSAPLSTVFTLPSASTDGGWNIDRYAGLGLFIGSVGIEPKITDGRLTASLSKTMTAAFTLTSGYPAWRSPGEYSCNLLPCPGQQRAGYSSASGDSSSPSVGVRVVETGTVSGLVGGRQVKYSPDATATVQGFAPATGKTLWSFAIGHHIQSVNFAGVPPQTAASTIVFHLGSRYVALDLATGSTSPLTADAKAWCERSITYHVAQSPYAQEDPTGAYTGGFSIYPCTVAGADAPTPSTIPSFVQQIGASADGVTAWTDAGSVHSAPN